MLCKAPFTSIVIEPDKAVRPCCIWNEKPFGNLNNNTIEEILNSDFVKEVQQDMVNNVWHEGCLQCKEREDVTGTSVRTNVYNHDWFRVEPVDYFNLQYLEYNSTNTCNLACLMCFPSYSSNALEFSKVYGWGITEDSIKGKFPDWKIHAINQKTAQKFMDQLDVKDLKTIWFKGGEPFLNKEIITVLKHVKDNGNLGDVNLKFTTNGTVINENILEMVTYAKTVSFAISIDGSDRINRYIRYGFGNPEVSGTLNIKNNIEKLSKLPNLININAAPAVQLLNIFDIPKLKEFWENEIHTLNEVKIDKSVGVGHILLNPTYLNLRSLKDEQRKVIENYFKSQTNPQHYEPIINFLQKGYLGDYHNNRIMKFINWVDKTRPESIFDIEPRFVDLLSVTK